MLSPMKAKLSSQQKKARVTQMLQSPSCVSELPIAVVLTSPRPYTDREPADLYSLTDPPSQHTHVLRRVLGAAVLDRQP